jgi:hypothetical protein
LNDYVYYNNLCESLTCPDNYIEVSGVSNNVEPIVKHVRPRMIFKLVHLVWITHILCQMVNAVMDVNQINMRRDPLQIVYNALIALLIV